MYAIDGLRKASRLGGLRVRLTEMSVARVGEINLAYEEAGAGEPIVLLHGYPLNRTMWREQVEELSARWRVITPDLRGHGETDVGASPATMERMAEDVASLLDELRIERAVVGGLSMGGYITLAFYRLFPERVRALILADTRARPDTDEVRRGREESAQKALSEGMKPIGDAIMPKMLAPATLKHRPEMVARVRAMIDATRREGAAAALRGMAVRRDQTEMLAQIKVPVAVLVGEEDAVIPLEETQAMCASIPGARLFVIEGAGHVSNIEEPAQFNRALVSFLEQLDRQTL